MAHPFRSARLTYRAVETPRDNDFLQAIANDAIGFQNANFTLAVPQAARDIQKTEEHIVKECLLGVALCITDENGHQTPVGLLRLTRLEKGHEHHRSTQMGIEILPDYQGKGYGSEAIEWGLRFAFESAGLHRVQIGAFSYNSRAKQLYERLGFHLEATLRESVWFQGQWHDIYELGMLDREWRALNAKK